MSDLKETITHYVRQFEQTASELYGGIGKYNSELFPESGWLQARLVLANSIAASKAYVFKYYISGDEDIFLPPIDHFLTGHGISEIAPLAKGTKSAAFEAKIPNNTSARFVLRIGNNVRIDRFLKNPSFDVSASMLDNRIWCPLGLQPHAQTILAYKKDESLYDKKRLNLELLPLVGIVQRGRPKGFDVFLNEHILDGTPYRVWEHKDLGVLFDGTPVYVDSGSLNFKSADLAVIHARDQYRPEWQQQIMVTIAKNCAAVGWPSSLSWVQQAQDGKFVTKQSVLYGGPLKSLVATRPLVRLREARPAAEA
jgi:hypothetical protein